MSILSYDGAVSLRYALLGMLAVQPGTGYELAQRFDSSMSNAWHASHSQIYPELAKLCGEGLLEVVGEGPRRSRTFGLTDEGHKRLRDWLVESEPSRAQRNETSIRWFLLQLLEPADRRAVLERELRDVTEYHNELSAAAETLDGLDEPHPFRPMVGLAVRSSQLMLDWLTEQLEATPE
jgi:PadR family transcriptional regulator AphA